MIFGNETISSCHRLKESVTKRKPSFSLFWMKLPQRTLRCFSPHSLNQSTNKKYYEDEDVIISLGDEGPLLPMGWALKSATVTRKNLTAAQKTYLTKVFQEGERTGQKADSANISQAMRRAKHSDGSSIFEKDDFLTPLQIAELFFLAWKGKERTALAVKTSRDMSQTKRRTSKSWLKKWWRLLLFSIQSCIKNITSVKSGASPSCQSFP